MSQFDQIIDKHGTNSLKHDFAVEEGYPPDVLPLWAAGRGWSNAGAI